MNPPPQILADKVGLQIKCLLELNCVCPVPFNSARVFVTLGSRWWKVPKYVCRQGAATMDLMLTVVGVEPKERESLQWSSFLWWTPHDPKGLLLIGETGSPVPYQNFYTFSSEVLNTTSYEFLLFLVTVQELLFPNCKWKISIFSLNFAFVTWVMKFSNLLFPKRFR